MPSTLVQSKERKGSNFAIWQPCIQTHLKKLFAGIHSVNFDAEEKHIITMNSLEGEVVPLRKKIRISSEVESWLSELAREMKDTLKASVESINAINLGTMNRGS